MLREIRITTPIQDRIIEVMLSNTVNTAIKVVTIEIRPININRKDKRLNRCISTRQKSHIKNIRGETKKQSSQNNTQLNRALVQHMLETQVKSNIKVIVQ